MINNAMYCIENEQYNKIVKAIIRKGWGEGGEMGAGEKMFHPLNPDPYYFKQNYDIRRICN